MKHKLLTIKEAAKLIGVKRTNIYYYIKRGLPVYVIDKAYKTGISVVSAPVKHVDEAELLAFKLPPYINMGRPKGSKNKKRWGS